MTYDASDNSATKRKLHFRVGHTDDAERLILKHHYSKRMSGNVQYVCTWHSDGGLFGDFGECVAACTFSVPPTRWSLPVLELSRLVRIPGMEIPLTAFLAAACSMLKRRGETLLVSFADNTQGHHGGIYQAASWNFSAYREPRLDGLIVNGQFVPGRSCNSRWGTRSPTKLAGRLGEAHEIQPHMDSGKFLYWKALNAKGRRNAHLLGLGKKAYPKPTRIVEAAE